MENDPKIPETAPALGATPETQAPETAPAPGAPASAQKTSYRPLLKQKQFMKLLIASVVNRFGDSLDAIACSLMMYEITGSAAAMALLLGLNYIPTIILQPITGVMVDKMKKKRIMWLTDVGRGVVMAACVLLYSFGMLTPVLLGAITILISTLEAFRVPAGIAITPLLIDKEYFTVGEAAFSSASRVAEVVGTAAGGAIVALIGVAGAIWIDVSTFFISALLIFLMRIKEDAHREKLDFSALKDGFRAGFGFLKSEKLIQALLFVGMLINFCVIPLNVFATPYIVDTLNFGPEMLSGMNLGMVAGMGIGSFIMPKLKFKGKTLIAASGVVVGLVCASLYILPRLQSAVILAVVFLAEMLLMGFSVGVINVVYSSAFMRFIPGDLLGRIGGIANAVLCASMPIGSFICSGLATTMELTTVLLVSGLMSMALYLSVLFIKPLDRL